MDPRGGSCKEALESNSKYNIYEGDIGSTPIICSSIARAEKHGLNCVQQLLLCSTCATSMYPPIHQCPNGHTMCANCKRGRKCCPTCCFELRDIRCLALEKVVELPCRYQSIGCLDMFPYHSKLKHEKHCSLRHYNCPYSSSECSVTGDIPFLMAHLKEDHSVDMHDGCNFNHRYVKSNPHQLKTATWMLTVINCFGQHLCLHFETFLHGLWVRTVKPRSSHTPWKSGAFRRKVVWQGVPRSIRVSHRKVRGSQDGLIIPMSLALHFPLEKGKNTNSGSLARYGERRSSCLTVQYSLLWYE